MYEVHRYSVNCFNRVGDEKARDWLVSARASARDFSGLLQAPSQLVTANKDDLCFHTRHRPLFFCQSISWVSSDLPSLHCTHSLLYVACYARVPPPPPRLPASLARPPSRPCGRLSLALTSSPLAEHSRPRANISRLRIALSPRPPVFGWPRPRNIPCPRSTRIRRLVPLLNGPLTTPSSPIHVSRPPYDCTCRGILVASRHMRPHELCLLSRFFTLP